MKYRIQTLKYSSFFATALALFFADPVLAQVSTSPSLPANPQNTPEVQLSPETVSRLRGLLGAPTLSDSRIGVSIIALGKVDDAQQFPSRPFTTGPRVLFQQDADKRFLPASNMKLFTAALALKVLGASRTFATRVLAVENTFNKRSPQPRFGPLVLVAEGDPSLGFTDLQDLARQVRKSGIKLGSGVKVDNSLFSAETFGGRYPEGWTLDDALWYYGPEVSSLAFNRNQIDLIVTGGEKTGDAASVRIEPNLPGFALKSEVFAHITTGEPELAQRGEEELVEVQRAAGAPGGRVEITGKVAPRQKVTLGLAVPNPSRWVASVFRDELRKAGVQLDRPLFDKYAERDLREVAVHRSPQVGELLQKFLKSSDNLYGEMLLRLAARYGTIGASQKSGSSLGTATNGHALLRSYLQSEGIDSSSLRFSDGSGLSRYNLLTPRAIVELLAAVEHLPDGAAFWQALPIAGVDGTLRRRMIGTSAQNNVRAKTGTFSIVSCLSGYVTTRDGVRLAVSVLTNYARNGGDARQLQNDIFALLADAELQ